MPVQQDRTSTAAESLIARLPRLSMITGLFALTWLIVVVLMIVRLVHVAMRREFAVRSSCTGMPRPAGAVDRGTKGGRLSAEGSMAPWATGEARGQCPSNSRVRGLRGPGESAEEAQS
ncbi:hypothetical protein [Streptomyces sp. NPDC002922]|uniref:hypothetical protein n=1 Tax=Streptomyces sp. NPDC002922 TaxID=3154439 RepID=UPI0033A5C680